MQQLFGGYPFSSHNSGVRSHFTASFDASNQASILLVDDNSFSTVATQCILHQYGYDCDTALDGREALNLVKRRFEKYNSTYTLILMDYFMPVCNGFESTI